MFQSAWCALRRSCGKNRRRRTDRYGLRDIVDDSGRDARRNFLESFHVVAWFADQLEPRIDRRAVRCCVSVCGREMERDQVVTDQDRSSYWKHSLGRPSPKSDSAHDQLAGRRPDWRLPDDDAVVRDCSKMDSVGGQQDIWEAAALERWLHGLGTWFRRR